ncbi:hypothetical protein PKF05_01530 [Fusobacterium simiae]|uniref:hypothetical protein n=1 Tax=Fusobacterium TaxID=848 RepID=UPI001898F8B0|nr:hypothetical protein [Fusobacterium simiae]MDC7954517.1 hypothetical protein [Fusobacterium simiae]
MKRNRILDILIIILFVTEVLLVKYFYQTDNLLHFRSLYWVFHEVATFIFLGISYIFLHEDIGYYDVFLILFPLIGISLLLLEKIFQRWKVSDAVIEELFSSNEEEVEKKEQKFIPEEFEIMSYYDLLSSDSTDEKKKFLFSFQPKEIKLKVKILKKALLDKNIDVIHYAATELNKIETELQNKINILEKKEDKEELYKTYKTYINSGLLYDSILEFYLKKAFELLRNLDKNTIDKEEELLSLCKLSDEKEEYENIIKKRIRKKEEKKDIQDYCHFLYQENRFEDLLEIFKKYKSKNIDIPYGFKQYIKE